MSKGGNFNEHLDEFNWLITELETIGAKIEEEDKAIILLVSLPPSYEHIRTTLMYEKDTHTRKVVSRNGLIKEVLFFEEEGHIVMYCPKLKAKKEKEKEKSEVVVESFAKK